ncbi:MULTISPECIES: TRAP transporter small permease subunit [Pseudovibrio]|uniref:TRAP transporter small permease protein n=1 Tax=Pseudovibrio brasiliensis TaxID=1898042 RepID=A0ABX8AWM4_9HYPH|nr:MULTISPECIES: TRAP transporter small permease [Pseudovibrio]EEA94513.1 trap dicarboxylate family transporter, dctq subunit [Pseudovibrio sp. JE062]QUS58315.1 TRAP transporter small permease [Pseudovibrio brasiliensis]
MSDQEDKDKGQKAIPEAGLFGSIIAKFGTLFSLTIVLSAAILIVEVAMRYLFNSPTTWAHETVIFLTATTFLFGGLYCASTNKHIRVVLIYDALSPEMRRVFNVAISVACALASALFSWAGWLVVKRAIWTPSGDFRLETSGSAWNPPTPGLLKLFLLGILILMCLQFAILAVNYAKKK